MIVVMLLDAVAMIEASRQPPWDWMVVCVVALVVVIVFEAQSALDVAVVVVFVTIDSDAVVVVAKPGFPPIAMISCWRIGRCFQWLVRKVEFVAEYWYIDSSQPHHRLRHPNPSRGWRNSVVANVDWARGCIAQTMLMMMMIAS